MLIGFLNKNRKNWGPRVKKSPVGFFSEETDRRGADSYCMNGMEIGYLKVSPFDALMLAIIMQITLSNIRQPIIGIPIMIKHRGMARTVYSNSDIWKLSDDLPLISTQADSSFLDIQHMTGPIIPPKGKK